MQEQIIAKQAQVLRDRRLQSRARQRHGRAHQHRHAGLLLRHLRVLPRDEAIEAIKQSIEKTYGKKGEEIVQKNLQAVDETLAHLFEVKVPDAAQQHDRDAAARSRRARRSSCATCSARSIAGRGDELPVSALPVRRHVSRPARRSGRSATSRSRFRCGTPKICIQCGKCAMVCPHAVIRIKVYDPQAAGRRAGDVQVHATRATRNGQGMKYTHPGRAGRLHRLRHLRGRLPGEEQDARPGSRRSTWRRSRRCASRSARTGISSSSIPETRPPQDQGQRPSASSRCRSRCSSSPAPARAAARRRTSSWSRSCSATALIVANATGCSSIYGGNLPTTPWTQERRRPRPGLVELAVRRQRRVRPRLPRSRSTSRRNSPANCCRSSPATIGDELVARHPDRRRRRTKPTSTNSASASPLLKEKLQRHRFDRSQAAAQLSPTCW